MKIPIPTLFFLLLLCLYGCKTTKDKMPAHYFTHKPQQAKTLVAQYARCECETRYARMTPHNWRVLPAIVLELYADSTFILAGNWSGFGETNTIFNPHFVHLSGHYNTNNEKVLLNLHRSQILNYPNASFGLIFWGEIIYFRELSGVELIVFSIDNEANLIRFCGFDEIKDTQCSLNKDMDVSNNWQLKPVDWLPKPFLLGTQSIDIDFFYDVTIYCRQAFPLKKWDER